MNNQSSSTSPQEFSLRPDARQQDILDSMLEGPLLLQRLLAVATTPVKTIEAASAFLDKHWQRLAPYMFRKGTGQTPKAMEALILQLANEPLNVFTINFPARCSLTPDQCVLLPIPELNAVALSSPESLIAARTGRRHDGSFSLSRTFKGYAVTIEFEPISSATPKPLAPTKAPNQPKIQPTRRLHERQQVKIAKPARKSGMAAQDFLTSFNNRVTAYLKQELAVSRQFTTTRFTDLSGWGVSGGLPSLPRKH